MRNVAKNKLTLAIALGTATSALTGGQVIGAEASANATPTLEQLLVTARRQ